MIDEGFQEREEATGETSAREAVVRQLPTYFVGYRDWKRLRDRVLREKGSGYALKQFHESALREGAVPLPVLSRLLTGKPL